MKELIFLKRILIALILFLFLTTLPSFSQNLIYVKISGGDSDIKSYLYSQFPEGTITTKKKYANYFLTIQIHTQRSSSGSIYGNTGYVNGGTRFYTYESELSFYLEDLYSVLASGSVTGTSTSFSPYVNVRFRYFGSGYRSQNNYSEEKDYAIQDALDQFQPYIAQIVTYANSSTCYQNTSNYQSNNYYSNSNTYSQPYNNCNSNTYSYVPQSTTTLNYPVDNSVPYIDTVDISSLSNNADINVSQTVTIIFYDAYAWSLSLGDIKQEKSYNQPTNVELVLKPEIVFDTDHPNKNKLKITIYGLNGSKVNKTFDLIR